MFPLEVRDRDSQPVCNEDHKNGRGDVVHPLGVDVRRVSGQPYSLECLNRRRIRLFWTTGTRMNLLEGSVRNTSFLISRRISSSEESMFLRVTIGFCVYLYRVLI